MDTQHQAQDAISIVMGLNILLGLVLCFSGYLISRIRVALGVLLGCIVAANIGFSIFQNLWAALVAGIIGGAAGALVSTVFYFLGLFLIGSLLGGFLGSTATGFAGPSDFQPWIVSLSALSGGVVVLLFSKLRFAVVLVTTALGGAALTVFGILCLAMTGAEGGLLWSTVFSNHGKIFSYTVSAGWILLAASGIVVQYKLDRGTLRLRSGTMPRPGAVMESSATIPPPSDIPPAG